jgi:hypothetical protein
VFRHERFRFVIWPNDHSPPHVHAFDADGFAIIELDGGRVRGYEGMSERDVMAAVRIVLEMREMLLMKWRRIHG